MTALHEDRKRRPGESARSQLLSRVMTGWDRLVREARHHAWSSPHRTFRLVATFSTPQEAELARQLLAAKAAASERNNRAVVVIFHTRKHPTHVALGKIVFRTLTEAGLAPTSADMYPGPPHGHARTWHEAVLPPSTTNVTNEEKRALRSAPARLLLAGSEIPVEGSRARWSDRGFLTLPFFLYLVALVAMGLSITVGLARTHDWFNWVTVLSAILAVAFMFWAIQSTSPQQRPRIGFVMLAGIVTMYALTLNAAWAASTTVSLNDLLKALVLVTVYVTVSTLIYEWIKNSQVVARNFLGVVSIAVSALAASGIGAELLQQAFTEGLGPGTDALRLPTLKILGLVGAPTLFALAVGAVVIGTCLIGLHMLDPSARWSIFLTVPLAVYFAASTAVVISDRIENAGKNVRSGNLTSANGVATCVEIALDDKPIPTRWSQPVILVGPATGPSAIISPNGSSPLMMMSKPLTVRPVTSPSCP